MKIENDKLFIRIVCLVISIGLWMTVMYITSPVLEESYTNIPVTIKNLSTIENSNLIMMNPDKEDITVTVKAKGLGEQLNNISSRDFSATISVLGFKEGTTNATVEVTGPSGIEIAGIYPAQIPCSIEGVISKVMDVTIQTEGLLANNYYKAQAVSNPTSVKITGPRSVINSADIAVASINIQGVTDTVVKTVPVTVYDDMDAEIFLSKPVGNVQATVPIYPTKYVTLTPTITGVPEEGYELVSASVKPERVKIAGKQELLDSITDLTLEELDITDAFNNILASRTILDTEGLILLGLESSPIVNTVIEKVINREFTFDLDDINFINQRENTEVTILEDSQEKISVSLTGTSSLINSLKKSDLILTADLAQAVMGNNTLALECVSEFTFKDLTMSKKSLEIKIVESEIEPGAVESPVVE